VRWVLPFENAALAGDTFSWLTGATAPHEQIDGLLDHCCRGRNISGNTFRRKRAFSEASNQVQSYSATGMRDEPSLPTVAPCYAQSPKDPRPDIPFLSFTHTGCFI
jgi:hypothetical protein